MKDGMEMKDLGIMEFSPVAQFAIGRDHRITRWNKACELLTGRPSSQMIGTDRQWEPFYPEKRAMLADLVVDHDRKGIKRLYGGMNIARSKVIPQAWETTDHFNDVGGQPRHLRFLAAPIYEAEGTIAGAVETFLDITEQKAFEQALIQSLEAYRVLAESVPDGVALMQDGKLLFVNQAFARMLGCSSSRELSGKESCFHIAESYKKAYTEKLKAIQSGAEKDRVLQWPCITRDGREIWVESHPNRIRWENRPAVLSTILDITEEHRRELAVREEQERLLRENVKLRATLKDRYRFGSIVGRSPAMQEIYELVLKAAASEASVIIYGESGTGKELVARAIHEMSRHHEGPFVTVNCGAIPETLLESEFFGHRKGAFTGAYADKRGYLDDAFGGTLFLDEVGELNSSMQVKLLRAIDVGEYIPVGSTVSKKTKIRIIAATNRNLVEEVKKGSMREDFFYRIHIVPIHVPALRERKEDIPYLVDDFLEKLEQGKKLSSLPAAVMEALYRYDWPGNVRELQNALHRYLTMGRLDFIHDPSEITGVGEGTRKEKTQPLGTLKGAVENLEKEMIGRALRASKWNKTKAASLLGMPRKTLSRKMKKIETE